MNNFLSLFWWYVCILWYTCLFWYLCGFYWIFMSTLWNSLSNLFGNLISNQVTVWCFYCCLDCSLWGSLKGIGSLLFCCVKKLFSILFPCSYFCWGICPCFLQRIFSIFDFQYLISGFNWTSHYIPFLPSWYSDVVTTCWSQRNGKVEMRVLATSVSDVVTTSLYDVAKALPQRCYNVVTTSTNGCVGCQFFPTIEM